MVCLVDVSITGKVHGSLARAGKVRGQTPKVAKQDKKKKPRGRAHKRMQYNRRFVTAGNFVFFSPYFTLLMSKFKSQCYSTSLIFILFSLFYRKIIFCCVKVLGFLNLGLS